MPYLESMTYGDFTSSNVCQLLIIGSTESISDRLLGPTFAKPRPLSSGEGRKHWSEYDVLLDERMALSAHLCLKRPTHGRP